MANKSDIFIYEIYSTDSLPVKKILKILRTILLNYKVRDKKFMWVNLKKIIPREMFWRIGDLDENLFFHRSSLYKAHTLWIPSNLAAPDLSH